ncbi:hypothetical protein AB395_00003730 [Sinorhizobium fredii CCBAU 45436]|nr:hypothetical protein SF83666_c35800 [Sinorhizobium fredii CCBAU 83666]AWI59363.1 hypothetical protein AB395_00003730 [Sinorhizobium fredii CCBAU 45436]AWM27040.1 hypothetical protein AOX55_00003810 [Sinorhizobium fredii CCBAU 25509]
MVHFVKLVEHGTRTPCFNQSRRRSQVRRKPCECLSWCPQSLPDYHFSCAVQQKDPHAFGVILSRESYY